MNIVMIVLISIAAVLAVWSIIVPPKLNPLLPVSALLLCIVEAAHQLVGSGLIR